MCVSEQFWVRLVLLEGVLANKPLPSQGTSPTLPSPGQDGAPEVMHLWCKEVCCTVLTLQEHVFDVTAVSVLHCGQC